MGETLKRINDKKKEDSSAQTLEYYKKINEMRELSCYSDSDNFLRSIAEFIEINEFITEKQTQIVDRIFRHPNYDK